MELPKMTKQGAVYNQSFKERVKKLQQSEWQDMYDKEFQRIEALEGGFDKKIEQPTPYRISVLYDKIVNGKLLDVGCGDGYVIYKILEESKKSLNCEGLDISDNAINVANNKVKGKFNVMSCENKLPDKKYDTILCLEVMEHVKEPSRLLKQMYDRLNPGGKILITVPIEKSLDWYTHLHTFDYVTLMLMVWAVSKDFMIYRINKFYEQEKPNIFLIEVNKE